MVKAADAIALFAAYAALIAIATVYQALALQALSAETDRLDKDLADHPQAVFARRQRKLAWSVLCKAAVVVVGTALVVFPLASWSDSIAVLMDPSDHVPQWTLLQANWLLRVLFAATSLVFAVSLARHDSITNLLRKRE